MRRRFLWSGSLLSTCLILGCGREPPMGTRAVVPALMILRTALLCEDARLLEHCEQRLKELRERAELDPRADERLAGILQQAQRGEWRQAFVSFDRFQKGQRPPP